MSLASVVGALRANLSLDTAAFEAGGRKAVKGAKNLESSFTKTAAKIGKAAAAIGTAMGAAVTTGTVLMANNAKEVERQANALGLSTEGYQALTSAAKRYGIEADKVSDILKDGADRLGEYLATGGGEMKDFMEMVAKPQGVSAKDILRLPPEQRLIEIQSLMEGMNLPLETQVFLWESLSDEASKLAPLLANNGAEFKRIKAELLSTGQILSDQVIKNLSTFSANLSGIGGIVSGWGNIFVSGFAGPLAEVSTRLQVFLAQADGIRTVFATMGQAVGSSLMVLADNIGRIATYAATGAVGLAAYGAATLAASVYTLGLAGALTLMRAALVRTGWGALAVVIGEIVYQTLNLVDSVGGVSNAMQLAGTIWTGVENTIKTGLSAIGSMFEGVGKVIYGAFAYAFGQAEAAFAKLMMKIGQGINIAIDGINAIKPGDKIPKINIGVEMSGDAKALIAGAKATMSEGMSAVTNGASSLVDSGQGFADAMAKARSDYDAMQAKTKAERDANGSNPNVPKLPDLNTKGIGDISGGDAAGGGSAKLSKYQETIRTLNGDIEQLKNTMGQTALAEQIWNAQRQAGVTASSLQGQKIAGLVTELERLKTQDAAIDRFKGQLGDMFSSIVTGSESARSALSNFFASLASNLANGAFTSFLGSLGGGGGFWGSVAGILGGGAIGANANGTSGWRGGLSWVGERGPELVSMPRGAQVLSNRESMNMMGGAAQRVHLDLSMSPDLEARILDKSAQTSVKNHTTGLESVFENAAPKKRNYQQRPA